MFVKTFLGSSYYTDDVSNVEDVIKVVREHDNIPVDVKLRCEVNGRAASLDTVLINSNSSVFVTLSGGLPGGKGGFGSQLRSIGAQIEKTTNLEAMR